MGTTDNAVVIEALSLALFLASPQGAAASLQLVSGADVAGPLPLTVLGLGDGGVGSDRLAAASSPRPGVLVTPGGVRVQAQREGVKLDFRSAAELLLAPDTIVHRRDGAHTAITAAAVTLWLADGTRVCVWRGGSRGAPLHRVLVVHEATAWLLWEHGVASSQRVTPPEPAGVCLAALGAGDTLYRAAVIGPLLTLELALGTAARPTRHVVIAGDVLAESLLALPQHVPPSPVQFPQAPAAAANLALAAPSLFAAGVIERPPGAVGEMILPLVGDFRMRVEERSAGDFWLELHLGDSGIPVVEWHAGLRTTLHLVRPDGGIGGGPRHCLRSVDVTATARRLLPLANQVATRDSAQQVLRAAGIGVARRVPLAVTREQQEPPRSPIGTE